MKEEKAFLRQKFIEFQLRIAELNQVRKQQEDANTAKEKLYFLNLFEVLDALEGIEESLRSRDPEQGDEGGASPPDKTARLLAKNISAIHRKLTRMLTASHIAEIDFPDQQATIDLCIVVDTHPATDKTDETILAVVKKGYLNEKLGVVLRKAEVITVLNS